MKIKPSKPSITREKNIIPKKKNDQSFLNQEKKVDQPYLKQELDLFKKANFIKRWVYRFKKTKVVLITMQFANGMFGQFIIYHEANSFTYKDGRYILDMDKAHWNITTKMWELFYHENFAIPIDRKLDVEELKEAMISSGLTKIEYAFNPVVLERWQQSSIQDLILRGGTLDEFMRLIRLLVIIHMVMTLAVLIILIWKLQVFGK